MLFQVYMLFLVCWCAVIFKEDIMAFIQRFMPKLGFVSKIINVLERLTGPVEVILFILAAVLGAYTGFLLSALISYPMLITLFYQRYSWLQVPLPVSRQPSYLSSLQVN